MKNIFLLFAFISLTTFSQESFLKFDKKFYECENEWATIQKKENDSTYVLGLVYYDPFKGYVFNYMNDFKIDVNTNEFKPLKFQITSFNINVVSNAEINFSIIPKIKYKELNIDQVNTSMNIPRYDEKNADDLVKKGSTLNHIGLSSIAIPILEKAKIIAPKTKNLIFELGYAYNATNQYKKAISLLHKAIQADGNDWQLYKEIIYALVFDNQLENAEVSFQNGIKIVQNKSNLVETAFNITYGYFLVRNKSKFEEWTKITLDNTDGLPSNISKNLELMKVDFSKPAASKP